MCSRLLCVLEAFLGRDRPKMSYKTPKMMSYKLLDVQDVEESQQLAPRSEENLDALLLVIARAQSQGRDHASFMLRIGVFSVC